jgi:hypothetical protein
MGEQIDLDEIDHAEWIDCGQCGGEGVIEGDCTCWDDTCCCLEPEPPVCDICKGAGGWRAAEGGEANG